MDGLLLSHYNTCPITAEDVDYSQEHAMYGVFLGTRQFVSFISLCILILILLKPDIYAKKKKFFSQSGVKSDKASLVLGIFELANIIFSLLNINNERKNMLEIYL